MAPRRRKPSPRAAEKRGWAATAAPAADVSHQQSLSAASASSLAAHRGRRCKSRRSDGALKDRNGHSSTVQSSNCVQSCATTAESNKSSSSSDIACAVAGGNSDNSSSCALSDSPKIPKPFAEYDSASRESTSSGKELFAGEASNSSEQNWSSSSSISGKKQRSCSSDESMRVSSLLENHVCTSPAPSTSTSLGSSFSSPALTVACNPCSPLLPFSRSLNEAAAAAVAFPLPAAPEAPPALPAPAASTSPLAGAATTAMQLHSGPSQILSAVLPQSTSESGTAASSLKVAAAAAAPTEQTSHQKSAAIALKAPAVVAAAAKKTAPIALQPVAVQAETLELPSGAVSPALSVNAHNLTETQASTSAVEDVTTKDAAATTGGAASSPEKTEAADCAAGETTEKDVQKQQQRKKRTRRVARGSSEENDLEDSSSCRRERANTVLEMPVMKPVDCCSLGAAATLSSNRGSQQRARQRQQRQRPLGSVGGKKQTSRLFRWSEAATEARTKAAEPAVNLSRTSSLVAAAVSAASEFQKRSWIALHRERGSSCVQRRQQQHSQQKPVCFTPNLVKSSTTSPTWFPFSSQPPASAVATVADAASSAVSEVAAASAGLTPSSSGAAGGGAGDVAPSLAKDSVKPLTLETENAAGVAADTSAAAADAAHNATGAVTAKTLAGIAAAEIAAVRRESTNQKGSDETVVSSTDSRMTRRNVQLSQMLTDATAAAAERAAVADSSWKTGQSSSASASSEPAGVAGAVPAKNSVIDALDEADTAAAVFEEKRSRSRRCSMHSQNIRPSPLQLPFHRLKRNNWRNTAAALLCAADSEGYFQRQSLASELCKACFSHEEEREVRAWSRKIEKRGESAPVAVEENAGTEAHQRHDESAAADITGTVARSVCPQVCEAFDSFVVLQLPRHLPSLNSEAMLLHAQEPQHSKPGAPKKVDGSAAADSAAKRRRAPQAATAKKTETEKATTRSPLSSKRATNKRVLNRTSSEAETQKATPSVHTQRAGALRELPDGYLGKLLLFKSGRVLLRIHGSNSSGGPPTAQSSSNKEEQQVQPLHSPRVKQKTEQQQQPVRTQCRHLHAFQKKSPHSSHSELNGFFAEKLPGTSSGEKVAPQRLPERRAQQGAEAAARVVAATKQPLAAHASGSFSAVATKSCCRCCCAGSTGLCSLSTSRLSEGTFSSSPRSFDAGAVDGRLATVSKKEGNAFCLVGEKSAPSGEGVTTGESRNISTSSSSNFSSLKECGRADDFHLARSSFTRDAEHTPNQQTKELERQKDLTQQRRLHRSAEATMKRLRERVCVRTGDSLSFQAEKTPSATTTVPALKDAAAGEAQQLQLKQTSEHRDCCVRCCCLQTTDLLQQLQEQPQPLKKLQQQQQRSRQNQRMLQEKREFDDGQGTHYFTVEKGSDCLFRQDCGILLGGHKKREFVFLGRCAQRFIVAPDISRLFDSVGSTNTSDSLNSSSREHANFCERQPTARW